MSTSLYKVLLRPVLFSLPPEAAQKLAEGLLKQRLLWQALSPAFRVADDRLRVRLAGMELPNPVGLAAGYDKDCQFLAATLDLGFGYVVGGTVTFRPGKGNPRPRLARRVRVESLVNSLGFPSKGLDFVAGKLGEYASRKKPVIVSVAGLSVEEFLECHRRVEPLVDAVELNISSPNTQGIRVFQEPSVFDDLVDRINAGRKKPLFVKLPPYSDEQGRDQVLKLVAVCVKRGVEGVTAINTVPITDSRLKVGRGGLSGRAILPDMLKIVADVRAECRGRLAVNACGGISTAEDAWKAFEAGANTVQLLTGLVYEGPGIAKSINTGLLRLLEARGPGSIRELVTKTGAAQQL